MLSSADQFLNKRGQHDTTLVEVSAVPCHDRRRFQGVLSFCYKDTVLEVLA